MWNFGGQFADDFPVWVFSGEKLREMVIVFEG